MKRDILILCQYFYPEYISSATLPYDTAKKLIQKGYSVDVLTGYPKEYMKEHRKIAKKENIKGINIRRVRYISLNRKRKLGRLVNYISFTLSVLINIRKLKQYRYVFVYSNPPLLPYIAYLGKKYFDIKIIYVLYDIYPEMALLTNSINHGSIIHKTMNFINKRIYNKLTGLVVLSDDMKDFIINNRNVDTDRIFVIENWYHKIGNHDIQLVNNSTQFEKLAKESRLKLVYTGNLGIAQDSDFIIEFIKANKNSKDVCFAISGHGSKMDELNELAKRTYFDNLYLYSFLHDDEYDKLLMVADAFLLSLKKELLGLASPSKLYSYLAAGKPIIALIDKNSHLAKFIINENIGLVSEAQNISELTKLAITLKSKYNYLEMCSNVINVFNKYYETNIATDKYVNMMNYLNEVKNYEW